MTGSRAALPMHILRLIREAGASAYRWHDETLADWLDPSGGWRRLADLLRVAGVSIVAAAIIATLIAAGGALPLGVAALVTLTWVVRRFRGLMWQATVGVPLVVSTSIIDGTATAVLQVIVLVSGVVLTRGVARDAATAGAALATGLVAVTGLVGDAGPWALAVVTAVPYACAIAAAGIKGLPRPFTRITGAHLQGTPPAPTSQVPWLVRLAKREQLASEPREIRRKRIGADGERRTAVILLGMDAGRGTRIAHDVKVPGMDRANVDHVVVARGGLFVIDTKAYGKLDDPGVVTRDPRSGQIVHRTSHGTRSLEDDITAAAWSVEGIARLLGVPPRVVIAVHNASVASGLVEIRNLTQVEVLPVWALPRRIDRAAPEVSWAHLTAARAHMLRLRSAMTGRSPRVVTPRGVSESAEHVMRAQTASHTATAAEPPTFSGPPRPPQAPRPQPHVQVEPQASAQPETPTPDGLRDGETSRGQAQSGGEPEPSVDERISDRWEQMRLSEPAPPDDVDEDFRTLARGDALVLIEFTDDDIVSRDIVAMSGVCSSIHGPYIWYCSPEQYQIHVDDGRKVNVATISSGKVMRRHEEAT